MDLVGFEYIGDYTVYRDCGDGEWTEDKIEPVYMKVFETGIVLYRLKLSGCDHVYQLTRNDHYGIHRELNTELHFTYSYIGRFSESVYRLIL